MRKATSLGVASLGQMAPAPATAVTRWTWAGAKVTCMASSPADLTRIRTRVGAELDAFIARPPRQLADTRPDLAPCAEAIADLLTGGKRLRAAFCYWGWRACGGADGPEIFAAAAALEMLHASALVHDDVMDASDTRRGQPAVHKRFAARHAAAGWPSWAKKRASA